MERECDGYVYVRNHTPFVLLDVHGVCMVCARLGGPAIVEVAGLNC